MKLQRFKDIAEDYFDVLRKSGYKKEDFLFHSKPYLHGFCHILNTVERVVPEMYGAMPPSKVLDLGVGSALTSYLLNKDGFDVKGIDIYDVNEEIQSVFKEKGQEKQALLWENLSRGTHGLSLAFYDGKAIPFEDNQFDLIFAHAVLEHIPANVLASVMSELRRVLRKDGVIVISRTPNLLSITEILCTSHPFRFTKKAIMALLGNAGFEAVYYNKSDFFPEVAPGILQSILNAMSGFTWMLNNVINLTPIRIFSHHHFIIARLRK